MTDINRELAEDAALDYSTDEVERSEFVLGWLMFCDGAREPDKVHADIWRGYIAARDAPDY